MIVKCVGCGTAASYLGPIIPSLTDYSISRQGVLFCNMLISDKKFVIFFVEVIECDPF